VGRLLDQKDYPTMLEAFQPLVRNQARLAIAGRGPELEALQRDVKQRGIAASVNFLGVRHDVAALLRAADGFVLSSAWEGMPNVVMEALASATPVVATEVGGVSELVERGRSGYLVPPRNAPALSTAMQQLMMLPMDVRRSMGLTGRERISANYGLAHMAQRWMGLFEELLARKEVAVTLSHREALAQDGGRLT
jgi:glycosyltransferase involved in cell wall biosynthesis